MPATEHRNFLDCVKSRKTPTCPVEIMHLLHASLHMGDISIRLNRKVRWDARKERFVDDPEADAMRHPPPNGATGRPKRRKNAPRCLGGD